MFAKTHLAVGLLAASSALAHFTLDYPATRGFDEDKEPDFCGGFTTVTSPRNPFPLSGGPIQFTSHHTLATTGLLIATASNPQSFNNFTTQANGTAMPYAENFFQVSEGSHCFNVDLQSLGLNLTNGSTVTLQMQFNGGDGNLFQCTDLVLLDNFSAPSNVTCTNDVATQANATITSSASVGAATSGSSVGAATSGSMTMSMSASASASGSGSTSGAQARYAVGGLAGLLAVGGALAVAAC